MKLILFRFILFAACMAVYSTGSTQWLKQNSGVTDDLQEVDYASSEVIYAGGAYGLLLKSTDAGETWKDITSPAFSGYVSSLKFISPDTGYVHGWGQIFKTYNGGDSWSHMYTAPSWHYFSMDLWDENHITIAGRTQVNPNEYWTTKTGLSGWNGGVYPGSGSGTQYHDMQYLSIDTVQALRFRGISRSTDGGATWTFMSNDNQIAENAGWNEFYFINSQVGYIGASNYSTGGGVVYKTTDGGQTYQNVGATADGIRAVYFVNEEVGFVGCEGGYIYKTLDGGETWYGEQHGIATIKDIHFRDAQHGVFVTEAGEIYTTKNGGNLIPDNVDGALLETDLHYVINKEDGPYSIKAIIRNEGVEQLNSIVLNYQFNDGPIQSSPLNNLSIGNLVSQEVTHSIEWSPNPGEYLFKLWIEAPNGQEDEDHTNDTISYYITVTDKALDNRNVLAEDATGAWCGWCPGVALTFDTLSSWYNTDDTHRFIPVALHNGDILTTEQSDEYALLWSGGAFPSSWFDRFRYFGNTYVRLGFEDDVAQRIEERFGMDAPVDIEIDFDLDEVSRELTIDVHLDFVARVDGDYRINCWLLENDLLTDQNNFFDEIAGHPFEGAGDPIVDYVNNHVLRDVLSDLWGDKADLPSTINTGSQYSRSYTFTIPPSYDIENLDIVAFVSEYDDEIDRRSILNAEYKTLVENPVSVADLTLEFKQMEVYPNPADEWIEVLYDLTSDSEVNIEIIDAKGRVVRSVLNKSYSGTTKKQIDVRELNTGIYYLKLSSSQGVGIRKVFIN